MKPRSQRLPVRTALSYALAAAAWILVTDALLSLHGEPAGSAWFPTLKGLLFVGVTTGVLYVVLARLLRRVARAEQALREQEERWRLALDAVGDGVWEADPLTGEARYTSRWKEMLGYADHELRGDAADWQARVHPDDHACIEEAARDYRAGRTPHFRCEYRLRHRDGHDVWVLSRGSRQILGTGPRIIGTHTDITGRKAAEQELRTLADDYRQLFACNPNPMWVYDCETLRILAVNEEAIRHYGYSREQFLALTLRDLRPAEDLPELERNLAATRDGGAQRSGPWRHRCADGRIIWVKISSHDVAWEKRRARLVLARDVTSQRAAQQELQLLHAAVQATTAAWVITDCEGFVRSVNPAFTRLTGYTAEEVVGKNPRLLNSGTHPPEFFAQMWRTIRAGEVWQGSLQNRRKDGTLYHEHMVIAPVRAEGGDISHFVAMKHDITAQHDLELQLARSQRLESVGLLASGIAHDLNNVLTPILLSTEILREEVGSPVLRERLDLVAKAAQRGAGILKQVLAFARGAEGERGIVQPLYLVKELVGLVRETFPREIRVHLVPGPEPAPVRGDVTQLHQVLLNLAINARDAMPRGGTLTLALRDLQLDTPKLTRMPGLLPGGYVEIVVRDTGTGIPPELIDRIFDPFFTTKPRGKGTGLGLSSAYGILRSHGGTVLVESVPDQGTTFRVLLPQAAEIAVTDAAPEQACLPRGGGRAILLVDDEEAIRFVLEEMLRELGFVVISAPDGEQALQMFRLRPAGYAAAIVDLMMPRMNGPELIARLRELAPGMPVIGISGLVPENAEGTEARAGLPALEAFLPKPFSTEQLLRALDRVLAAGAPAGCGMEELQKKV